ncbi:MAG TPA: DNA repair protein RecO [Gemmatimonadota bacterium]|nr:DNA repair protein RecO [Gemmatimonadota bacterium]
MAIVRTEAFVLKAFRFGETSMIYRLLTRDRGVVPVIARGARGPKSRLGAAVNAFRRLDVTYYDKPSREIQTLSQAEVVADYPDIVSSLEKLEVAGLWFRFLRSILPDGAPAEPFYALAVDALVRLERTPPSRLSRWETYHRAAAAGVLGLAPRLDACMACERPLPDDLPLAFSIEEGGLACRTCAPTTIRPLTAAEYALLALYHHPDWTLVEELDGMEEDERRVQALIHLFVAYHADLRPPPGPPAG